MSDRRRVAERNAGAFLGPSFPPIPAPMNALYVGPGKPGPGDDWKIPTGPLDEIVGQDDVILEPVDSDGTILLPRRPTSRG